MPNWIVVAWDWFWHHREGIFGGTVVAFLAFLLGAMKWWYEVKELSRKERERKLERDKEAVMKVLRMNGAFAPFNGQTVKQITAQVQFTWWPPRKRKRVEAALHSLTNETPMRVHRLNGAWCIGEIPLSVLMPPL